MKKQVLVLSAIAVSCVALSGCALLDKFKGKSAKSSNGTKDVKIEKEEQGGLLFTYDGNETGGMNYELNQSLVYVGPAFGNIPRADGKLHSFVLYNTKEITFVWYDKEASVSSSSDVINACSKDIFSAVSTDLEIVPEGAIFQIDKSSDAENHNNIERTNFTGTITAFDEEKNEKEIPFNAYGFVADGKPGIVMSVITADKDADKFKEEIANNSLVLMNTVVVAQ